MEQLKKVHAALQENIEVYKTGDRNYLSQFRSSLIKHFKMAFDATQHRLKKLLQDKYGIIALAPKEIIRECFHQKIMAKEQTKTFLDMADAIRLIPHTYNENLADQIAAKIPEYYKLMVAVVEKANP